MEQVMFVPHKKKIFVSLTFKREFSPYCPSGGSICCEFKLYTWKPPIPLFIVDFCYLHRVYLFPNQDKV